LGVGVGGGDRAEGREGGVLAGFGLGLLFLPSIQPDIARSISGKIFMLVLKRSAGESPWSVCIGRKREKGELAKVRVCMAEFKFEFEFLQTRFKINLKMVSRGTKCDQELMAKV
jgi:hypothetical protein